MKSGYKSKEREAIIIGCALEKCSKNSQSAIYEHKNGCLNVNKREKMYDLGANWLIEIGNKNCNST